MKNIILLSLLLFCTPGILSAQLRPPFNLPMDSAGLPNIASLTYSSTADGRMAMTPGSTLVHPTGPTFSPAAGGNRLRGNLYEISSDRILAAHDFYLDRPQAMDVDFVVYEAMALAGPYSRIHSKTVSAPAGAGHVSSGDIFVPLRAERFYLIGAAWSASATLNFQSGFPYPLDLGFGQLRNGYLSATYPAPDKITSLMGNANAYRQRLRTEVVTPETVPLPAPYTVATFGNIFRGNIYEMSRSTNLARLAVPLTRSVATTVTFSVHESNTRTGTYQQIASQSVTVDIGSGWVQAPPMPARLVADRFYLIGAHWNSSTGYEFKSNAFSSAQALTFGSALEGKQFAGIPAASFVNNSATITTGYVQEIDVVDSGSLRMDASVNNSLSINRADLALDLSAIQNATLRFTHRSIQEEAHDEGVYLSNDNVNWFQIQALPNGNSGPQEFSLDLVQAVTAQGLSPHQTVYLRFQQQDDYPSPSDGREFSNILVDTPPDLRMTSISPLSVFFFRGLDIDKPFPFTIEFERRGGNTDFTATDLQIASLLQYLPGTNWTQTENLGNISFPAYSVVSQSYDSPLVIPAAIRLPNTIYPLGVNLDSNNQIAEASETNNAVQMFIQVNHYSGFLWFDDVQTKIWIESMTIRDAGSINTAHTISGHGLFGTRAFTFTDLQVDKNLTTLDYAVIADEEQEIPAGLIAPTQLNGVTYQSEGPIRLTPTGVRADIRTLLPAGLGWETTHSPHILQSDLLFSNVEMTPALGFPLSVSAMGERWFAVETLPLRYRVSNTGWLPASGTFALVATGDVLHVRASEYALLDFYEDEGFIPANTNLRRSNDGYYRHADGVSNIVVVAGANGEAVVTVQVDLAPGQMVTHMPYDVEVEWNQPSEVTLLNNQPTSDSKLNNVVSLMLRYTQGCPDNCPGADQSDTLELFLPTGEIRIGRDGGLHAPVSVVGVPAVQWGWEPELPAYTQRVNKVNTGIFHAAGHVAHGPELVGVDLNNKPGTLLLSGMGWNNPDSSERPWSSAYQLGKGTYPGLNFRMLDQDSSAAQSIIGGTVFGPLTLTPTSKFYLRHSGVTGVYNAGLTELNGSIYGYPFDFETFAFNYLSNENLVSRTDGALELIYPTQETVEFERMKLTCKGGLDNANPAAGANQLLLAYWDADFRFSQLTFERKSGCAFDPASLLLRGRSHADHIPEPLFAELGFWPDGNLIRPADERLGISSRFSLPAAFQVPGPSGERYAFMPTTQPYLNHYLEATNHQLAGQGYFSVAGSLSTPFFGGVRSHLQSSAGELETLPLFLAGVPDVGWGGDNDPFSHLDTFDPSHRARPPGVELDAYVSGAAENFRARVRQTWGPGISFDFPLRWSPILKAFRSPEAVDINLAILSIENQILYLSPGNVEISFGLQIDGLPRISLGNLAFDAMDSLGLPVAGALSASLEAGLAPLTRSIERGTASFERSLNSLSGDLLEPVYDRLINPVVDELYDQLLDIEWEGGEAAISAALDRVIRGQFNGGAAPAWNARASFAGFIPGTQGVPGLADQLIAELDRILNAVNALNLSFNPNPDDAAEIANGLLHRAGNGRYEHLEGLTLAFLDIYFQGVAQALPPDTTERIRGVIAKAEPGLQAISMALAEVRAELLLLREQLQDIPGAEFRAELNARVSAQLPAIDIVLGRVKASIEQRIFSYPAGRIAITEMTAEEFKALIRRELIAEFNGSVIAGTIHSTLRARLRTPELAFRLSADTLFQQFNSFLRDIASSAFAELDAVANDFLGSLNGKIGGGNINGYAHIRGDMLAALRLDAKLECNFTSPMRFEGGLVIDSQRMPGLSGPDFEGAFNHRISFGAEDVSCDWLGGDLLIDVGGFISLNANNLPVGLGGHFGFDDPVGVKIEQMTFQSLGATVAMGLQENYLGGFGRASFDSVEIAAGMFFGRAISPDPIVLIDPDAAQVIGANTFTGGYVYGEAWIPIKDIGCVFNVSAGVGAGFYFFVTDTGNAYGIKMAMGAKGEALCVVTIRGEVRLTGGRSGGKYRALGRGTLSGSVGPCDWCLRWRKEVSVTYDDGSWDVDY